MMFDQKISNALTVPLPERKTGLITRLGCDRQIFAFDQGYTDAPQRPTLSLAFKGRTGGLVTALRPVPRRVPPFFSNLLPEGHLREYLAKLADVNPEREFFLPAVLGADLPGALVIEPVGGVLREADAHHEDDRPREAVLRFSLAGVQLKFPAVMEASGGLTVPAGGMGGSWIVKLPSARFAAVPENEFAMLELARRAGIVVPDNRLVAMAEIKGLPEEARAPGSKALAVQRFDRMTGGAPVHMEAFSPVFGEHPNNKYRYRSYANIAAVLWAEAGEDAVAEFVRRLVFSVVIGNSDMPLKTGAPLYPDHPNPLPSPAHDFLPPL